MEIIEDFGSFALVEIGGSRAVAPWDGKKPYIPPHWAVNMYTGNNIAAEIELVENRSIIRFDIEKEAKLLVHGKGYWSPIISADENGLRVHGDLLKILGSNPTKIFYAPYTDFLFVFIVNGEPVILRNMYYDDLMDEITFEKIEHPKRNGWLIKVDDSWYSLITMKNFIHYVEYNEYILNPLNKCGLVNGGGNASHFNHGPYEIKEILVEGDEHFEDCFFVARRGGNFYKITKDGVEQINWITPEIWKKGLAGTSDVKPGPIPGSTTATESTPKKKYDTPSTPSTTPSKLPQKHFTVEAKSNALYVEGDFGFAVFPHVLNGYYIANLLSYEIVHRRMFPDEKWGIISDLKTLFEAILPHSKFRRHDTEHYRVFEYEIDNGRSALIVYHTAVEYVHREEQIDEAIKGELNIDGIKIVDKVGKYYILEDGSIVDKDGGRIWRDKKTGIIVRKDQPFYVLQDKKYQCCYDGRSPIARAVSDPRIVEFIEENKMYNDTALLVDKNFRYAGSPVYLRPTGKVFKKLVRPSLQKVHKRHSVYLKSGVINLDDVYVNPMWRRGCRIYQYDGKIRGDKLINIMETGGTKTMAIDCNREIKIGLEL